MNTSPGTGTCTCGAPAIPGHPCPVRADLVGAFKPIAGSPEAAPVTAPRLEREWDL